MDCGDTGVGMIVDLGVLGDHRLVCHKVLGEEKKQGKSIICNNVHKKSITSYKYEIIDFVPPKWCSFGHHRFP